MFGLSIAHEVYVIIASVLDMSSSCIRLLEEDDIGPASVCLVRGSAGTREEVDLSAARSDYSHWQA